MKNILLNQLIEAREQLERLKIIYCRMAHERVLIDRNSHLPVAGTMPDVEFQRIGLCSAAVRYANPVCSHTMARYQLENALDLLEQRGEYQDWRIEFNDLDNAIHLLDHKKGDAEKHLAQIIRRICEDQQADDDSLNRELALITGQITGMEQRHNLYAEKIEKLKNNILAAINSAIEIEESKFNFSISGDGF